MAPVMPLGRDRAIALLVDGKLPFSLGSPHPIALVLEQDGRFRIRSLVVDPDEARRAHDEARASGRPFMPEQYYALGKPIGEIHADAATRDELRRIMSAMDWPADW